MCLMQYVVEMCVCECDVRNISWFSDSSLHPCTSFAICTILYRKLIWLHVKFNIKKCGCNDNSRKSDDQTSRTIVCFIWSFTAIGLKQRNESVVILFTITWLKRVSPINLLVIAVGSLCNLFLTSCRLQRMSNVVHLTCQFKSRKTNVCFFIYKFRTQHRFLHEKHLYLFKYIFVVHKLIVNEISASTKHCAYLWSFTMPILNRTRFSIPQTYSTCIYRCITHSRLPATHDRVFTCVHVADS